MTRLAKRDVEHLLAVVDEDPVGGLLVALRKVLDRPGATWCELLAWAPFDAERRQRLEDLEPEALWDLVAELNELRTLPSPYASAGAIPTGRRPDPDVEP